MKIPQVTVGDVQALLTANSQSPVLYLDSEDGTLTLGVWDEAYVDHHLVVIRRGELTDWLQPDHPDGLDDEVIEEYLPQLQEDVDRVAAESGALNTPMTAGQFRVVREYLGVTGDWLAGHLEVNPRTVRGWEQGRHPIPDHVRTALEELQKATAHVVDTTVTSMRSTSEPRMTVYRTDEDYAAAHPEPYSAGWHRAVAARTAQRVPGLTIAFPDETPEQK